MLPPLSKNRYFLWLGGSGGDTGSLGASTTTHVLPSSHCRGSGPPLRAQHGRPLLALAVAGRLPEACEDSVSQVWKHGCSEQATLLVHFQGGHILEGFSLDYCSDCKAQVWGLVRSGEGWCSVGTTAAVFPAQMEVQGGRVERRLLQRCPPAAFSKGLPC